MESRKLGNIYGFDGGNYAGNVYEKNDIAPTLTNMQGGNRQPMIIDEVKELGFMDNGTGKHQSNTVVDENGLEPTVTTVNGGGQTPLINCQYRIRKLTPRECYRLMAVPEKDIDKILEVNSNTQCYKQAGNSIVVNCLIAIFSQMGIQGIPRWNEGLSEKYK